MVEFDKSELKKLSPRQRLKKLKELEEQRKAAFDAFMKAKDNETKRERFFGFASVTSLRSSTFIAALDRALGLKDE